MLRDIVLLPISLILFDGGASGAPAGASAGASAGAAAGGEGGAVQAGTQASPASGRRGKTASGPVVVYGKQTGESNGSDAESGQKTTGKSGVVTTDVMETKRAAFEDLINGEYKDIFTERVQKIINQRFKETKTLQAQVEQATPILEMLRQRYNLNREATLDQIQKALENDDAYWEAGAEEAGMTVEQFKYVKKLERENAAIREMQQRWENEQKANETYRAWLQQAEAMKEEYPDFDLQAECENQQFVDLLRKGVDVKTAYEVTHIGDIKKTVAQATAKQVEANVVSNIRAKGARPTENGVTMTPGIIVKDDVSGLTPEDRKRIVQQTYMGKTIRF